MFAGRNQEWAIDFVVDSLARGRSLRVLTIMDSFTRKYPAIEAYSFLRGRPMQNGHMERFNGRSPDACPNANWFLTLAGAKAKNVGARGFKRHPLAPHPRPRCPRGQPDEVRRRRLL